MKKFIVEFYSRKDQRNEEEPSKDFGHVVVIQSNPNESVVAAAFKRASIQQQNCEIVRVYRSGRPA